MRNPISSLVAVFRTLTGRWDRRVYLETIGLAHDALGPAQPIVLAPRRHARGASVEGATDQSVVTNVYQLGRPPRRRNP